MNIVHTDNEYYQLCLQREEEDIFLHLEVHKWSKSVYHMIREDLDSILDEAVCLGLDAVYSYTTNLKFAKMFKPCEILGDFYYEGEAYFVVEFPT